MITVTFAFVIDWSYAAEISKALLTQAIGIVTVYIAYQQYRNNKSKLRQELYDRWLALWTTVAELISKTQQMETLDGLYLNQFLQKTRESYFLFGPKVDKFVTQLYRNGVDLRFYAGQLDSSSLLVGDQRTEYAEKQK